MGDGLVERIRSLLRNVDVSGVISKGALATSLIASPALAQRILPDAESKNNKSTLQSESWKRSAVYGRLRDGLTNIPIVDGYVFAVSENMEEVLGYTNTLNRIGQESGFYQITSLPGSGDVWLIGFHPKVRYALAKKKVRLNGRYQEVESLETDMPLPQTVIDNNIIALLNTIREEIKRIKSDKEAIEITEWLLGIVFEDSQEYQRLKDIDRTLLPEDVSNPVFVAREFLNALQSGHLMNIRGYSVDLFSEEMFEGMEHKRHELSEKIKDDFSNYSFQRIYEVRTGAKFDSAGLIDLVTEGCYHEKDDFTRVDLEVLEGGFRAMFNVYLFKSGGTWRAYNIDIDYEPFCSELEEGMLRTSKFGEEALLYRYPPQPSHNGVVYGVTRGYVKVPNNILDIRNRKFYKYEFFEYRNGDWNPLLSFNGKKSLSGDETTYLGRKYKFDSISEPHVLGNLLIRMAVINQD